MTSNKTISLLRSELDLMRTRSVSLMRENKKLEEKKNYWYKLAIDLGERADKLQKTERSSKKFVKTFKVWRKSIHHIAYNHDDDCEYYPMQDALEEYEK